jgi:hypothetical protein
MKRFTDALPLALISTLIVSTPLLAATERSSSAEIAAIFPPGWQSDDVMRAVASTPVGVVRFGAFDNVVIVSAEDDDTRSALFQAGAWLLLPPGVLGGCLLPRDRASNPESETHDPS